MKLEEYSGPTGARFSEDRKYRYVLWRRWSSERPMVMCIGLNPSTANENTNDPTIRKLCGLLKQHYGGFFMCNLYALVTPYPYAMFAHPDPLGENNLWLQYIADEVKKIVFCWGNFKVSERAKEVEAMFPQAYCFGLNKNGSPKHPLYLPADTLLEEFM